MAVFLSLFAGAGQQFFTNAGVPLAGGKIFTYGAGGSTPQATYTTSAGNIAHSNPIVLDAAGRVPAGGEIWLTSNLAYKFVLQTAANVTVQTLDNVGGGVDGASLAASSGSSLVGFIQAGSGAVARTVQSKLREMVSLKDFGAVGDGVTNDTLAIQKAIDSLADNDVLVDFSDSTYLVDTLTIQNKNYVTIQIHGTLRTTGSLTGGITIKKCRFLNLYVKRLFKGTGSYPASFPALTGIGYNLVDTDNSEFGFHRIEGFATGIRLYSETTSGVYFNAFKFNSIQYCLTSIQFNVADGVGGFINANKFYGESLRGSATEGSLIKTIKGTAQIDPYNGNEFNVNIESGYVGIDLDFASGNFFLNRFESGAGAINSLWVKNLANCFNNTYRANFFPLDNLQILGASETFVGPVMNTATGVSYGNGMWSSQQGNQLHVLAYRYTGLIATSSNGVPVKTYVFNADTSFSPGPDQGVTGILIRDSSGDKRIKYAPTNVPSANNANLDVPYDTSIIEVRTDASPVDLLIKTSQYQPGVILYIDVLSYTNNIRVLNEAGSSVLVAGGIINSTGMWMIYTSNGYSVRSRKLS